MRRLRFSPGAALPKVAHAYSYHLPGVLFAALIGYMFLGETLTAQRILACVVIVSGTLIIG